MLHCLTRHAGKGARESLKRMHDVDDRKNHKNVCETRND